MQAACNSISIMVSVGNSTYNQTTAVMNHPLEKKTGEKVVVKINYAADGARADGEFDVSFGNISMIYSTIDDSTFEPPVVSSSENQNTINYKMKNMASGSDVNIDFKADAVAGIYYVEKTINDKNPIYYYRGAVTNNNVLFANFCWKIVRTTETGGVKLLYNGTPTNGQCNGTNPILDVGYIAFNTSYTNAEDMRYIHEDGTNSNIKGVVDSWYAANMTKYTRMLEDEGWCMDLSEYDAHALGITDLGYEGAKIYGAMYRVYRTQKPDVSCELQYQLKMSASNIGNKLKYPVALLTADEIYMAGARTAYREEDTYINSGHNWWGLSPMARAFHGIYIATTSCVMGEYGGYSSNGPVMDVNSGGARPAISLAANTEITGTGDGTAARPFVIE